MTNRKPQHDRYTDKKRSRKARQTTIARKAARAQKRGVR